MKLNNFKHYAVTGTTDDSFVGLKIKGDEIQFYYPESYHLNHNDDDFNTEDILNLLKTISIAKTQSKEKNILYNSHSSEGDFALYSYLWIIRDWLNNGFYINREKEYKINQNGRVNWKKTLNQQPIVSNGNIIYNNIVVEVKSNVDNIILDIHKYCVKKSLDYIGWLFNLNSKTIHINQFTEALKIKYKQVLQLELDKTYDDIKRIRLTHMLNVITGLDVYNDSQEFVYGVDSYYYIFERMIDSIFGTEKDLSKFNPKASWRLVRNNYEEKTASPLRPDTILLKEDFAYILDSKFYRFGFTADDSDLPETTSIQKQITYADYLLELQKNNRLGVNKIYNAFIMPYDKLNNKFKLDRNIEYIGYAKTEWKDNKEQHQFVYSFLIDLHHVVKVWNDYNHNDDVTTLIKEINFAISENKDIKSC